MLVKLPYGMSDIAAEIPWAREPRVIDVGAAPELDDPWTAVLEALENPIGMGRSAFDGLGAGQRVTVIVSDSFRKTGSHVYMPALLHGLNLAGVRDEDVTVLFATGTHRPPTESEQRELLSPEAAGRLAGRLVAHDARDPRALVALGTTSRGTPLSINRLAVQCDRLIVTGGVVLHYFAGFGGGRKALLPGVAGIESISKNHSMNLDPSSDRLNPDVEIGKLDGNPVAEDMLEGARSVKVHCTLNTVLNREGRIAGVFAGELDAAHRAACDFAKSLYAVPLQEQADLVIAASGPTKNYVQSHKALYNAYQAVKPEGRIVLAARCEEGLGGEQFAQWVRLGHPEAIMRALRQRAEINGQTALSTLQKTPITLMVTDLSDEDVRLLGARKAASFEAALETARKELAAKGVADPACYVMPSAAYSVPMTDADAPPA